MLSWAVYAELRGVRGGVGRRGGSSFHWKVVVRGGTAGGLVGVGIAFGDSGNLFVIPLGIALVLVLLLLKALRAG